MEENFEMQKSRKFIYEYNTTKLMHITHEKDEVMSIQME